MVVEDDESQATLAQKAFETLGFDVDVAYDGAKGLGLVLSNSYTIALVDMQLPKLGGAELIAEMRRLGCTTPVAILSCLTSDEDTISGYRLSVEQYIHKPCSMGVLAEHLRAIVTRLDRSFASESVEVGDVVLNRRTRRVTKNGEEKRLTPTQYNLLEFLFSNRGRMLTYDEIASGAYGRKYVAPHTIGQCLREIRLAFGVGRDDFCVKTYRGSGYGVQ